MGVLDSAMPSTKPLLHIVMDQELIDRIDDFRFANRFPSRAATVKWLIEQSLASGARPSPSTRSDSAPQDQEGE